MLTSEVIERKLPTINTKCFSESTCDALLSQLLRGSSSNCLLDQSALKQLACADSAFADWLDGVPANTSLTDRLVRDPGWRDGTTSSERLWQMANIAVRLQALEQRFTDELAIQKREAIYHFAYGLSHELNNPLANIATRAGVLVHRETEVDRRQMLESIIDNAMRGSEMLGDLMLLARPPLLNRQSTNLHQWFEAFVERCSHWGAKRNLKVDSKCDLHSMTSCFDPVAMTEAGWCLVRNAFEASRDDDRVEIHLTDTKDILLTIRDSGPGLSAEALRNCFDPYYSGREAGRGLGLGLSKAQLIATMHEGSVKISNRPGGGCEAMLTWRQACN